MRQWWRGLWLVIGVMLLTACGAETSTPQPLAPTSTLLPASPTASTTPSPGPQPSASVIRPADLPTYTPVANALLPADVGTAIQAVVTDIGQDEATLQLLSLKQVEVRNMQTCRLSTNGTLVYRIVVSNGIDVWVYHATGDGVTRWCEDADLIIVEGTPLFVDPIAGSLAELAVTDLAQRLSIEADGIRVADVTAVTWRDTSWGCPVPRGSYNVTFVDGYRILLAVGDTLYTYHTDGIEARFCDLANELLPVPIAPTPTPIPSTTPEPSSSPPPTATPEATATSTISPTPSG